MKLYYYAIIFIEFFKSSFLQEMLRNFQQTKFNPKMIF